MLDLLQTYRGKAGDKISEKGGSIFTKTCCLLAILSKDSKRALVRPRVFFLIAWFILAFCFSCMFWCYVYVQVIFFPLLARYPLPVITELCRWENAIPRRGKQSPASAVWLRWLRVWHQGFDPTVSARLWCCVCYSKQVFDEFLLVTLHYVKFSCCFLKRI